MASQVTLLFLIFSCLFCSASEKSIVVVVPSYNNAQWYKKNLDSILSQDYQNFRILYIDDASTDGTGSLVRDYILETHSESLIELIQNPIRLGALANIYSAVWKCDPTDIIVTVDGDDWLYHSGVLERINDAYRDPNVWMSYGQKIDYPTNYAGGSQLIPYEVTENREFREFDWVSTHLRTFYAGLFQKIQREDFLYMGAFFPVAWDLSFMFPMLEMSGFHSRFISDILYVYNVATPLNDRKLHKEQQIYLDSYIRSKERYETLESLFEERPWVTCDLRGGLGNQLFQIATTLAYAWEHGAKAVFPDLNRSEIRISNNKDRIFFRLDTDAHSRAFENSFHELNWHSTEKIPFKPDLKLFGYFQSWTRFAHYRDKILKTLAPPLQISNALHEKYSDLLLNPNTVALHVRTFTEGLHNSKQHPFVGMKYYEKAMDLFPPNSLFVIFSDRINWCKKHFSTLGKQVVFIEGNDPIEDFFLMTMMKHNIICNSSYSWWGAYLNQNPDQIVIAPANWMHKELDPFPEMEPEAFYPPHWRLLSPDESAPYPEDITFYDTSIDDILFK